MPNEAMLPVKVMDIAAQQSGHQWREVLGLVQADHQVDMVAHQAVVVQLYAESCFVPGEQGDKMAAVVVVRKNSFQVVPALRAGAAIAGWRANWTGLYPDARTPLEWGRTPLGILAALRARADKPDARAAETSPRIENGLVRDWLFLGPFAVQDVNKDL